MFEATDLPPYEPPAPEAVEIGPPIRRIFTPDTELALT